MRAAKLIFITAITFFSSAAIGQISSPPSTTVSGQDAERNVITTAMPFLLISPDSRSAGMGDVGVALSADANAMQWNAARLAFVENEIGASISYSPWLRSINVDDMSISYLSGYYKITKEQVVGISMKYFDLGNIFFTDDGSTGTDFSPKDFSISAAYSRKLSDNLSASLTGKFVRSNLFGNYTNNNTSSPSPATALGVDLGVFYTKELLFSGRDSEFSSGLQIANISNKVSYSGDDNEQFLPINMKIGTAFTTSLDAYNKLTIALDFNKLMVPTPIEGDTTNATLLEGMFGSFSDAPGGFQEEMREISISSGIEYTYNNVFAVRTGYFYEHFTKGGRQYFTAGVGFRYQVLGLDFSYLIPTTQNNPLAETLRFTAVFKFEDMGIAKASVTE
ncbi:type IX secretion system outer membrane channel protein PorV [Marivirga salinae]|uniref:Type IX secretion system outer membrane channel protein PorV n=1 Tax=Marivirga salinarum TaxID=3059078 RepID=A0AA51NEE6_9BACT|nr:type IX secretion system outer membrane channel protein PorV [Marivirga sp. BDSF4-3]WMN12671.1 type IX secretion system outer membrane channel protein PorV [Marivirga sp. BDSF4-3]